MGQADAEDPFEMLDRELENEACDDRDRIVEAMGGGAASQSAVWASWKQIVRKCGRRRKRK